MQLINTVAIINYMFKLCLNKSNVVASTTWEGKLFHVLMALGKKEFLYASIIVGSCKSFNEWPLVTLFANIN